MTVKIDIVGHYALKIQENKIGTNTLKFKKLLRQQSKNNESSKVQ